MESSAPTVMTITRNIPLAIDSVVSSNSLDNVVLSSCCLKFNCAFYHVGSKDSLMSKVLQTDATDIPTLLVLFYVKVGEGT